MSGATEVKPATDYRQANWTFRILQWIVRLLLHSLFVIEVKGLENLPREGGYILAGNHLSWIDPFLMLLGAPASPKIYFVAAREEVESPAWRKFMIDRAKGIIPVDRQNFTPRGMRNLADQASEVLAGGGVLGIFPEGDVSGIETGKLLPFKKGLGYFAAQSGAPIVPVAFRGTKELWLRKRIVMVVGQPIAGRKGTKEVISAQTEATFQAIQNLMPPVPRQNPKSHQWLKRFFTDLFTQEYVEHPTPE